MVVSLKVDVAFVDRLNQRDVETYGRLSASVLISLMEVATGKLAPSVARSHGSRDVRRELGWRGGLQAMVRYGARVHRALASSAGDSLGRKSPWRHGGLDRSSPFKVEAKRVNLNFVTCRPTSGTVEREGDVQ